MALSHILHAGCIISLHAISPYKTIFFKLRIKQTFVEDKMCLKARFVWYNISSMYYILTLIILSFHKH